MKLDANFDRPVPPGGYAWWYLDAISDDGRSALTVIGFVGSVFSPYYAWSGRRDPEDHVAINVALYGPSSDRWAMTERGRGALERRADLLRVGPSSMTIDGDALIVSLDELGFPKPTSIRGRLRLEPTGAALDAINLDPERQHFWRPLAARARIEAAFERPELRFSGDAYFDCNWGAVPLASSFRSWTWSRASLEDRALVLYEVEQRDGRQLELGLDIDPSGAFTRFELPPTRSLRTTGWGLPRTVRSEPDTAPVLVRTLEDTPFYSRSLVRSKLRGASVVSVHESLSVDRLEQRWVNLLLPFRMPRLASRRGAQST